MLKEVLIFLMGNFVWPSAFAIACASRLNLRSYAGFSAKVGCRNTPHSAGRNHYNHWSDITYKALTIFFFLGEEGRAL
jgi:hypothetical protein